ncbi:MAG: hypothetical protein WD823_07145 [Sulfuricaulis sp.]|uniref:hypothetical protein n=1 Tax=Sulfuricaulis sp. TaxID=2003553 RepID=UPI0034A49DAE
MDKNRLEELRQLVEDVMYASTKKEAQYPIKRLEFMASTLRGEIDGYLFGKLGEVISYAKEASGQVKNKDHWISCVERCWYVFESRVDKEARADSEPSETKT